MNPQNNCQNKKVTIAVAASGILKLQTVIARKGADNLCS